MMRRLLRDPRRLRAAFVLVMVSLSATLAWLALALVENDRQLTDERRETAADQAVAVLQQRLNEWRLQLDSPTASTASDFPACGDDCTIVRVTQKKVVRLAGRALVYDPAWPDELRPDPVATTLLQEAVRERSRGKYDAALATYARLEARGADAVASMPAALAARAGRLGVYRRVGDSVSELNEARALARELEDGRWPVSFSTYKHLASEARGRLPAPEQRVPEAEILTDGVTEFWDQWRAGDLEQRSLTAGRSGEPLVVTWTGTIEQAMALVAGARFVDRELLADAVAAVTDLGAILTLESEGYGQPPQGAERSSPGHATVKLAAETGLPWTVRASTTASDPWIAARRSRLFVGFGLLAVFILAGGWFVGRSMTRELEVAHLKTDFVAAVSHEFRTPLTTIVQLAEMLKADRVGNEVERQEYYDLLHGEGNRLRRLIERLLTFGRVESGQSDYGMVAIDVRDMVVSCLADFEAAHAGSAHVFGLDDRSDMLTVVADREALAMVMWNLLENAVKYSPDGGRIEVGVVPLQGCVEVSVADSGLGIPAAERERIFEPFVRGAAARDRQIRGTGVGLALARTIVRAHGGQLTVESSVGHGSTFRMRLPV